MSEYLIFFRNMLGHFMEQSAVTSFITLSALKTPPSAKALCYVLELFINDSTRLDMNEKSFDICVVALHPSQQFFSHVGTISCLTGFDQH